MTCFWSFMMSRDGKQAENEHFYLLPVLLVEGYTACNLDSSSSPSAGHGGSSARPGPLSTPCWSAAQVGQNEI